MDLLSTHKKRLKKMLEFDQPESMGPTSQYVDKPGIYHCLVTHVDENPTTRDGRPKNSLDVTFTVLCGTNADQADKVLDVSFWLPGPDDSSEMPRRRLSAFCLATNLISEHQPGGKASVEPSEAVGQQCVCKFAWKQRKNEATGQWEDGDRLYLAYSDIWHVDNEQVAKNSVPLDENALTMIPDKFRSSEVKLKIAASVVEDI